MAKHFEFYATIIQVRGLARYEKKIFNPPFSTSSQKHDSFFHSFDVFEVLILSFDKESSVLNYRWSLDYICYLLFLI